MSNLQIELKGAITGSGVKRGQLAALTLIYNFTNLLGQLAAAQYSGADNLWHRVRVEGIKGESVDVNYIDFGNV